MLCRWRTFFHFSLSARRGRDSTAYSLFLQLPVGRLSHQEEQDVAFLILLPATCCQSCLKASVFERWYFILTPSLHLWNGGCALGTACWEDSGTGHLAPALESMVAQQERQVERSVDYCPSPTKCLSPRVEMLLKQNLATVSTPSSRTLSQRLEIAQEERSRP